MKNEPRASREIHEIREQIYNEIKDMTPEGRSEYYRKAARKMIEKHGLKIARAASFSTAASE